MITVPFREGVFASLGSEYSCGSDEVTTATHQARI